MRKNLYHSLFVAVVFFVGCSVSARPKSGRDQSEPVAEVTASFADLFKEVIVEKAQLGLEALQSLLIKGLANPASAEKVDFKQLALRFVKLQKYELQDIGEVDYIRITNGVLILSPGKENTVRYLALPEQKKNVTCKKTGGGVQLGFASGGRKAETIDDVVVFVATYAHGFAPKVVASGAAQVFARSIKQDRPLEVVLSDSARYVAQDVTVSDLKINLAQKSSYNLISSNLKNLSIFARDEAQADIIACTVENKAVVDIRGTSFKNPSRVSLQGTTPYFDAHVAGGILDSASFKAEEVVLRSAASARVVQVSASKGLSVLAGAPYGELNPGLVIEYTGDADLKENSSRLKVRKAITALSVASVLGSVDGVNRAKMLMQNARNVIEDGMKLFDNFSSLVRG